MKKLVAAAFAAKLENIAVVGPPCSREATIFVNLGVPGGPQNAENWPHVDPKNPFENSRPFKNSPFFDFGVTLWGFWFNLGIFRVQEDPQEITFSYLSISRILPIIFQTLSSLSPKTTSNSRSSTRSNPKMNPQPPNPKSSSKS